MSATFQFHLAHLDSLFSIIGSADRDLLLDIGVTLGAEFRAPSDDEENEYYGDEQTEEMSEWDVTEEEADTARETIIKMVMSGLSPDLAEDEAYAVQDYFASYTQKCDDALILEPDDLHELLEEERDSEVADEVQDLMIEHVTDETMFKIIEWLQEMDASHDLITRLRLLTLGRLPEADEPTFTDLEDEAYTARFGYLFVHEMAKISEEINHLAPLAAKDIGVIGYLLAALFAYCVSHSRDLVVTIDE